MHHPLGGPVKAVFFDLDDTLAGYQPGPEDLLVDACREFGFDITSRDARRGWLAAGRYYRRSAAQIPFSQRSVVQVEALHVGFDKRILVGAGLQVDGGLAYQVFMRMLDMIKEAGSTRTLYDDALPTLKVLRTAGLTVGVVSNIGERLEQVCHDLGLSPWLDVVVGPEVAGVSKPDPRIFRAALRMAGVPPRAAAHVGDNPLLDAAGSRRAGLGAILLDRYGACRDVAGIVRVRTLGQILDVLLGTADNGGGMSLTPA